MECLVVNASLRGVDVLLQYAYEQDITVRDLIGVM